MFILYGVYPTSYLLLCQHNMLDIVIIMDYNYLCQRLNIKPLEMCRANIFQAYIVC